MQEVVKPLQGARDLSRREFIATSAVASSLALLESGARAQDAKPVADADKIHIALVGFGAQGRVLLESLVKIDMVKLVAIVDIWDYARDYGVKYLRKMGIEVNAYENHEEMLAKQKDLQAVVVATPDFWHSPVSVACLEAGLDVYCEKMMSNTVDGARKMVQAMKKTGNLLQIGHQRRSNPRYLFALNRLMREAKLCGRITAANAQWNRAVSEDLTWPKKFALKDEQLKKYGFDNMHEFKNWRWFKKYGGGPLSDLGAHQIDIFNWWFDKLPTTVVADGGVDYYKNHDWFDNAMVIYTYDLPEGRARALYQVQTTTSAGGGYWEYFMGTDGSLKMSENPKLAAVFREARAPSWDEIINKNWLAKKAAPPPAEGAKVDVRETAQLDSYEIPVTFSKLIHQPHLENFFKAVLTKKLEDANPKKVKLNCPADEAYRSEMIIFKAIDSIEQKKLLEFKPEDFEA